MQNMIKIYYHNTRGNYNRKAFLMEQKKTVMIEELKRKIRQCRVCEELFGYEPQPIFWGESGSKIMQISQAPSLLVHQSGRPFNDLSGKRLRKNGTKLQMQYFMTQLIFILLPESTAIRGKIPGVVIESRLNIVLTSGLGRRWKRYLTKYIY